jgi:two-component system phosphate regulon sensor histidine kinase PhoR
MSTVPKLTLVATVRVALLALIVGGSAALAADAMWGLSAAMLTILACFGYYALKLAQLEIWLDDPRAATTPDGAGRWGDVLAKLYRVIREERAQRDLLAGSLARFQQAASALPDGAVMLDDQHNIVWCNPTAESHWGVSLKRDRMQTITYFIRQPEFLDYLKARNYGEPLALKIARPAIADVAAVELTISVQLVPFGDDQMLLLSQDISTREFLETMRRDFVANVSHELRTPLTVMVGFLETVTTAGPANPALLEKSLRHMTTQTVRMQRLVDDLLTLSRLEDNRNKPVMAPINIPELVSSLVADAEQLSNGHHRISVKAGDAWLVGSRDEIQSAFGNLVTNAVRYTPDGGHIEVVWSIENRLPVFRVRDDGEGIAPEHLPRLTERFYRVDRGRSRASGGTGLGLAIVKHVLIRHGARLEIQSSQGAAEHGTTFSVIFPAERLCVAEPGLQAVAA